MRIVCLGHACFCIELENGTKIVADPYQPGAYSGAIRYDPPGVKADIVSISHAHADHAAASLFPGAQIVDSPGRHTASGIVIEGVASYHDACQGAERGGNIIFCFTAEALNLVHCGDLGTVDFVLPHNWNADIAMIPVGGTFTLDYRGASEVVDKLKPKIVIPMHFKTEKLDFNIAGADDFLGIGLPVKKVAALEVSKQTLPATPTIFVLEHQR